MSDIKVSEMPEATQLNNNDLLMVIQNGTNKKSKIENLGISGIQEKLNKVGTYSTEETDTGKKWIDGKSIYRVVLTTSSITSGQTKSVSISSYNFERIVGMKAIGTLVEGSVISIPYIYAGNSITMYEENQNIRIASTGYNIANVYITMEYTKNN